MFNNSDYLFQLYFGYTLGNFMQKLINLLKCLLGFFVLYQLKCHMLAAGRSFQE